MLNMQKDDIFIFSQKQPKHLGQTHGMDFDICDNNIQY